MPIQVINSACPITSTTTTTTSSITPSRLTTTTGTTTLSTTTNGVISTVTTTTPETTRATTTTVPITSTAVTTTTETTTQTTIADTTTTSSSTNGVISTITTTTATTTAATTTTTTTTSSTNGVISTITTTTATTTAGTTTTTLSNPQVQVDYRLPKSLKPFFYDITTITRFDSLTEPDQYDGIIEIHLSVNERTNCIIFHHVDLMINSSTIKVIGLTGVASQINVMSTSYNNETSLYNVSLASYLEINQNYSISMNYVGKLLSNNVGFYKSSYTDKNGARRWLVASHMEPLRARRAFPCFDEPAMKAKFKMTVVHDSSVRALSNMPSLQSTP